MQRLRRFIRTWLGFSRTETNGFIILLPLMILVMASAPVYRFLRSNQPRDFSRDFAILDSIKVSWDADLKPADSLIASPRKKIGIQKFDPNNATVEQLLSLGFPKHLSTRIVSYRQKGGVFRVKRDLLKIYGVDSTYYNQLYPYIDLPVVLSSQTKVAAVTSERKKAVSEVKTKINLNDADTLQLKKVKGIGKVLAARIVKFRDALGGFISTEQLKEVYGLDSMAVLSLSNSFYVEENFEPERISINQADQGTLELHPYISRALARSILSYRYQHGRIRDTEELKKLLSPNPAQAEKLLPYLRVND